jgi:hypothetical protein
MMTDPKKQAQLDEVLNDARKAVEAREQAEGKLEACCAAESAAEKALHQAQKELGNAQAEYDLAAANERYALEAVGPSLLSVIDSKLYTAWEDRSV